MRVLKVEAEGLTTSFRYPHFMQQIHPSFQMPPPATIYGHIASALGEWFDPDGVQFAYRFTHSGSTEDKEHVILLSSATGFLPGTKIPKVLEGNVNPFEREILFHPKLTLYVNRPEWEPFFHSPRFAVVLGRSQDLFTYTRVETVDLQQAGNAYLEHTLASYEMGVRTQRGVTVLMPRYLDYSKRRFPTFSRYIVIKERIKTTDFLQFGNQANGPYWVDPTSPEVDGLHRGLVFLSFTGDDGERFTMA